MIHVRTPSRLHFGMFAVPSANASRWLNQEGAESLPRRRFGGVGLMIDEPRIELRVESAKTWSAQGPLAERALQFARTFTEEAGIKEEFRIVIHSAPPSHVGLGVGTQLALAVGCAIARLHGRPLSEAKRIADYVRRGQRSAVGIHGFEQGGFLVEGGKLSNTSVSPLLWRCAFPSDWQILLITPRDIAGTHGRLEVDAFADLANQAADDQTTESMCRIVLLGLLPALAEADMRTFGEALYDFNRRAGELFRSAQGGLYAHLRIEQIVKTIREFGVKGVGQSSWGPTIFALVTPDEVGPLQNWLMLRHGIAKEEMTIAIACNRGAIFSA